MRLTLQLQVPSVMAVLISALLPGCSDSRATGPDTAGPSRPLVVHAVNYPLSYFAERIGGDRFEIEFLAPPDDDPAFWHPTDADIGALQAADLILLNGANYAKWRRQVSLPESRLVDTSRAFRDSLIDVEAASTHSHGPVGDHSHGGVAFTTWIDMRQARRHAEAVRDALIDLDPDARAEIEANAAVLLGEIDELDAQLEIVSAAIGDQPLVASHPVYQYFARRYGLSIEALLWEPETVPDDEAMSKLEDLLEGHAATWMIWEGDPVEESVSKLQAVDIGSLVFDPCGNRPAEGDWLDVMRRNVLNLEAIGR